MIWLEPPAASPSGPENNAAEPGPSAHPAARVELPASAETEAAHSGSTRGGVGRSGPVGGGSTGGGRCAGGHARTLLGIPPAPAPMRDRGVGGSTGEQQNSPGANTGLHAARIVS